MRKTTPRTLTLAAGAMAIAMAALAFGPCGEGVRGKQTPTARSLSDGETIGKVDRASSPESGVAVRTLLSVTCRGGQLIVRTNLDAISGGSDCKQPIPQAALDQFLGRPVVITYSGGKVVVESAGVAARLELEAQDATVGQVADATP